MPKCPDKMHAVVNEANGVWYANGQSNKAWVL